MKAKKGIWKRIKDEITETIVVVVIPLLFVVSMFAYWLAFGY